MYYNELANFNLKNPLDDYLHPIVQQFKNFFGKKYARQIENRIANCTILFAERIDSLKTIRGLNSYYVRLKRRCTSPREVQKLDKDFQKLINEYYDSLENYNEYMQYEKEYLLKVDELKNSALSEIFGVSVENPSIYDYLLGEINGVEQDPEAHNDFKYFLDEIGKPELAKNIKENFADILNRTEKQINIERKKLKGKSAVLSPAFVKTKKWLLKTKNTTLDVSDSLFAFLTTPGYSNFAYTIAPITENNPENIKTLIIFPSFFELDLGTIVHELGHVVQANRMSDERFKTMIGYQPKTGLTAENIEPYVKLTYLDEAFNEYIAYNVCKNLDADMFDGNVDEPETSAYATVLPIIKPFFDKYRNELIECSMGKDPDLIFKKFDRELIFEISDYITTIVNEPEFKILGDEICFAYKKTNLPIIDVIDNFKFDTTNCDSFVIDTLENFKEALKELDRSHEKANKNIDFSEQSGKTF